MKPDADTLRLDLLLALALFSASLALRVTLVSPAFDGLYGQDAYAYHDFALSIRSGQPLGAFFWPLGYPALLALAYTLFGAAAQTGQAINFLLGALLSPLVYALARQMNLGRLGALAAALVMTVCGQSLQSSAVLMADIPALFWATLSAVALLRYRHVEQTRWLVASAALLALACVTRWLYLALAVPWALVVLLIWRGRICRGGLLAAAVAALFVFLPQIAYSLTNPYPTLDHAWVRGWSPDNFFRREFANPDGHFVYVEVNAQFFAHPFYDAPYLSLAITPFLLVGVVALWKRQRAEALMLTLWTLLPYGFLAGIPYQNVRFPLIIMPAVAVFAGAGLDALIGKVYTLSSSPPSEPLCLRATGLKPLSVYDRRKSLWDGEGSPNRWVYAQWGAILPLLLFALGIVQIGQNGRGVVQTFVANQQRDKDTAAWTVAQLPPDITLYTFGLTLTLKHYTGFDVYELYYETPNSLAARWTPGKDDYLLLNVWNIENQWAGREPQIAYHWLRDRRGLTQIGQYGNYLLFRIGG